MTKVLNDNRKYKAMTEGEADNIFALIATLEIDIVKICAQYDKKIALIQIECQKRKEELEKKLEELSLELDAYIEAHPERFIKPRSKKTVHGKYGMRNVSNLDIYDETALIEWSDREGICLYERIKKIRKDAVKDAIKDGKKVEGAKIVAGEERFHTVEKKLLDNAKENVLS